MSATSAPARPELQLRRRHRRRAGVLGVVLAAGGTAMAVAAAFAVGSAFSFAATRGAGADLQTSGQQAEAHRIGSSATLGHRPAASAEAARRAWRSSNRAGEEDVPSAAMAQVLPGIGEEKVAIITGASTGIGLATAEAMARSGRYKKIIFAGRDEEKHQNALSSLGSQLQGDAGSEASAVSLEYAPLNLASLASVRTFAQSFIASGQQLDTLILNAGVMAIPDRQLTEDGYEYQFGVNHLGHFLLTNLLMDSMVHSSTASDPGRIIVMSSAAHSFPSALSRGDLSSLQSESYNPWIAYGQSKLANLLFTYELDRRCRERGLPIVANAVNPGAVDSELARHIFPDLGGIGQRFRALTKPIIDRTALLRTTEEGARTSALLATSPEGKVSGRYWLDGKPKPSVDMNQMAENLPGPLQALRITSYNPDTWASLWRVSETLTGLQPGEAGALEEK